MGTYPSLLGDTIIPRRTLWKCSYSLLCSPSLYPGQGHARLGLRKRNLTPRTQSVVFLFLRFLPRLFMPYFDLWLEFYADEVDLDALRGSRWPP